MEKIKLDYSVLVSLLIFSGIYFFSSYQLLALIDRLVYAIVLGIVLVILYFNILRFFLLQMWSLSKEQLSEVLSYIMMYALTVSVLILPFFIETNIVFESETVRNIIIVFATILLAKYSLYMLVGPWHDIRLLLRHKKYFDYMDYNPLVSVVIPAWNEGVGVISTIQSLLKSTYRNLEIVIINDGSTDDSDEKMRAFLAEYAEDPKADISLCYQYQNNTGKGGALNHGISIARGEIIITIDADCLVDANAVAEFVRIFKDPTVSGVVGNVKIANKNGTVGVVQYLEFLFSFYFKRADALFGSIYIIGGAAGAFRRSVFEKIGGYTVDNITEDIELSVRMQDAGMKIEYANEAVVYTEGASDLASLKKQRLRWKRGRFQTFYQYSHLFFSTKKRHNKFLTWVAMPLAMLQEVHLLLEIPFLVFLYVSSLINSDFSSFLTGVLMVGMMFVIQFLFYDKSTRRLSFILLAPIGWILFYLATYVEAWALVKSIESILLKKEVTWQKWTRKGITAQA